MNQAPARFSFADTPDPPAFSGADQLPLRPVEEGSQVRMSYAHYLEICQARVDDREKIKNARIYIELQEQSILRLEAELRDSVETIDRLREDRRDLLSVLREIHEAAPAEEPKDGDYSDTDAEARGFDKASWDAGEIARAGIEKVGATVRYDIPRRRAS